MADVTPNSITAAELADRVPDIVIITGMSRLWPHAGHARI